MSNHRIVYRRPDGGVSVIVPAPGFVAKFRTEADAIAAIRAKDVPADAVEVVETTVDQLPQRRKWRNAWRLSGGQCVESVGACRPIHKARLRRMAKLKLAEYREKREEAAEDGDSVQAAFWRTKAKDLRTRIELKMTEIDAALTPDEVDAVWDSEVDREDS